MLAISGATLALSVTFAHDIAKTPPAATWALGWAWIALIAAIVAIVLSVVASQWALRSTIDAIDDAKAIPTGPARVTLVVNAISGFALVAGLVLLAVYALMNAPDGR